MQCPKCSSDCWDNREKVAGGWKGPLWKCKDKDCAWVKWPEKGKAASPAAVGKSGPKWTWNTIAKTYERALLVAEMRVAASADRLGVKATLENVLQATSTVFIEAARSGVAEPQVKLPPPPEPDPDEDADSDFPE